MEKYNKKLLLLLLILSLISCKTLTYKKPAVKKPVSKFADRLSKNKNGLNKNYGHYYSSKGNFFPKDMDKAFKNFSLNTDRAFKNFQITLKKMSDNIAKSISNFFESIKKFFKPKNRYAKKSEFAIWWDNFYNHFFKKKR